jgi:hypothetical protein
VDSLVSIHQTKEKASCARLRRAPEEAIGKALVIQLRVDQSCDKNSDSFKCLVWSSAIFSFSSPAIAKVV